MSFPLCGGGLLHIGVSQRGNGRAYPLRVKRTFVFVLGGHDRPARSGDTACSTSNPRTTALKLVRRLIRLNRFTTTRHHGAAAPPWTLGHSGRTVELSISRVCTVLTRPLWRCAGRSLEEASGCQGGMPPIMVRTRTRSSGYIIQMVIQWPSSKGSANQRRDIRVRDYGTVLDAIPVRYYIGTTETGSSGSGLFYHPAEGYLVGVLSAGHGCNDPSYYGSFRDFFPVIRRHIDPGGTEQLFKVIGRGPFFPRDGLPAPAGLCLPEQCLGPGGNRGRKCLTGYVVLICGGVPNPYSRSRFAALQLTGPGGRQRVQGLYRYRPG